MEKEQYYNHNDINTELFPSQGSFYKSKYFLLQVVGISYLYYAL